MTGAAIFAAVLRTLWGILWRLLAACLILLLLILLVPVRYRVEGSVQDRDGGEFPDWNRLKEKTRISGRISWLFPVLEFRISWPEKAGSGLRILGFSVKPGKHRKKEEPATESSPKEEKQKKASVWKKEELLSVLRHPDTKTAIGAVLRETGTFLGRLLPGEWSLSGTAGLGEPEQTGKLMEAQSILFPLVCDHVWVQPDFEHCLADLTFFARGKLRLIHLLAAGIRLLCSRKVMLLVRRFMACRETAEESAKKINRETAEESAQEKERPDKAEKSAQKKEKTTEHIEDRNHKQ